MNLTYLTEAINLFNKKISLRSGTAFIEIYQWTEELHINNKFFRKKFVEFLTRESSRRFYSSSSRNSSCSRYVKRVYSCTADSVLERTKRVRYGPVRIRTHDRPITARRSKFGAVFGAWRAVRFAVFIVKRFPRIVKSRSLQKRSKWY